jgi:hypothetical protein
MPIGIRIVGVPKELLSIALTKSKPTVGKRGGL